MRVIGEFKERAKAQKFSDYLTKAEIENEIIEDDEEGNIIHELWVHNDDDLERSEELLAKFVENPEAEEFQGVEEAARKKKREARKESKDGPNIVDARTTVFNRTGAPPRGLITMIIIFVCVAVAVFSDFGSDKMMLRPLFIQDPLPDQPFFVFESLPEVSRGEVWRLFTPMLIHFGILHLLFNMLWMLDLGSMVEDRKSSVFYFIFVMSVSLVSNLAQYAAGSVLFGGMSGVVYGLLGYVWIKGKSDPGSRLYLHPDTVFFMIVWYFLCLFGVIPHVANAAHTAGLVMGMAWGFFSSEKFKRSLK